MPFTKDDLLAIRADMPRGYCKKLADKHNLSHGSIRNIMSGVNRNDAVILSAIAMKKAIADKLEGALASLQTTE
jgi:hypothetical protein